MDIVLNNLLDLLRTALFALNPETLVLSADIQAKSWWNSITVQDINAQMDAFNEAVTKTEALLHAEDPNLLAISKVIIQLNSELLRHNYMRNNDFLRNYQHIVHTKALMAISQALLTVLHFLPNCLMTVDDASAKVLTCLQRIVKGFHDYCKKTTDFS